jgi:DNA-binding MarR family transcriptional regulator
VAESTNEDRESKAKAALAHAGHEADMRREMAKLVADFFGNLKLSSPVSLPTAERDKLVALAVFTTRCRSAVERDSYQNREIQLIPGVESPTRLVKVLSQLLRGLQVIGVGRGRAWDLVTKVALDSMPALRQRVILAMLEETEEIETSDLAAKLGYPTNTTRRTLEDLGCYEIVSRRTQGKGKSDLWTLTDWTRNIYEAAKITLPEILKDDFPLYSTNNLSNSISGKVTNDKGDSDAEPPGSNDAGGAEDEPTVPITPCPRCGHCQWAIDGAGKVYCAQCQPEGAQVSIDKTKGKEGD